VRVFCVMYLVCVLLCLIEGQSNGGFQEDAGLHNQDLQGQSQMQRTGQLEEREEQLRELDELQQ